jgi:hypothetical protein
MPIQFECSGCGQPIEVDDEHAGKSAACPYCQRVVTVPSASTYAPSGTVGARPVQPADADDESLRADGGGPAATPLPASTRDAHRPARERAARSFGNYALICAAIVSVLLIIVLGYVLNWTSTHVAAAQDPESMQELAREFQARPEMKWLSAAAWGMLFFAVVGVALGIVSLTQRAAGNWRGWVSTLLCGSVLVCFCLMMMMSMAMLAGGSLPSP